MVGLNEQPDNNNSFPILIKKGENVSLVSIGIVIFWR